MADILQTTFSNAFCCKEIFFSFDYNFTKVCLSGCNIALVQVMVRRQTCSMSLHEAMISQFDDA